MIAIDLPAKMKCEHEKGCDATLGVELVLQLTGGFAVKTPQGHGWQVMGHQNLFRTRCPQHYQLIEEAPTRKLELIQ